jgi:hypothetical protein
MLIIAAVAAVGVTGCSKGRSASGCPDAMQGSPVDTTVMAYLSAARALHHEADVKADSGDVAGAIAALEKLIGMARPRANEVDEVLADTHARLAEMRLESNDWTGANRDVHAGLEHAREPTYFRGHLLEVAGLIEEKRAGALADAGKRDEAAQAKGRAVQLLESAVKVQEQVIAHALEDGGARD